MANSTSNALAVKIMRAVLHNEPLAIANVYVGVTVAGVEPVGKGYARTLLDASKWSPEVDLGDGTTETHQTVDVFMPQANGGDWGNCDGYVLCDALTGGTILLADLLSAPQTILNTNQFKFPAGQIVWIHG